ncbi:MAG TPA: amidohydrolase [Lentisphaeria bacterium]|nr:amidohydrolase [Lentisphaeria bacterium]|tara:strand:+ start:7042 stop:7824 length:783 start_codon:yes stop_codon:yes gene_type:complete
MIIDIHTHHFLGRETLKSPKPVEPLMCLAKQAGVTRMNLLGNLFRTEKIRPPARDVKAINTLTMRQVQAYPDFFTGFCYLNPVLDGRFLLDEIDRCVAAGNLIGLKFEIDLNCRDPRLDPLLDRARELDIPVLHHSWHNIDLCTQPYKSDPPDIADLAARHPQVTIIMPHLAGVGVRGVLDVLPHPNVLIDTSGGLSVAGLVEYAVDRLGPERLLYGSDVNGRDFSCQIGRVLGAQVSAKVKEQILWRNAARVLKLGITE